MSSMYSLTLCAYCIPGKIAVDPKTNGPEIREAVRLLVPSIFIIRRGNAAN